jgi:hypothetical protein
MNMTCFACGKRFRSMIAEARHRHNFPTLCTRNKRFERWAQADNLRAMQEVIDKLPDPALFIGVWTNTNSHIFKAVYEMRNSRVHCLINALGRSIPGEMAGTSVKDFLGNKLRLELIVPERWEGFHMLIAQGMIEEACKLVGHPGTPK